MEIGILIKIAGIGLLVAASAQILSKWGRDEQSMLVVIGGIVVVLLMLLGEIEKLFDILRRMRDDGKSIIIITHKMNEVLSLTDRVAVMRKGQHIATVNTKETSENELTEMMMGEKIELNIKNIVDFSIRITTF